jgi:hypothetical protein
MGFGVDEAANDVITRVINKSILKNIDFKGKEENIDLLREIFNIKCTFSFFFF